MTFDALIHSAEFCSHEELENVFDNIVLFDVDKSLIFSSFVGPDHPTATRGTTLLHAICKNGAIRLDSAFVETALRFSRFSQGAVVSIRDSDGLAPIHHASKFHKDPDSEAIFALVKHGADVNLPAWKTTRIYSRPDVVAKTPLHFAVDAGNIFGCQTLVNKLDAKILPSSQYRWNRVSRLSSMIVCKFCMQVGGKCYCERQASVAFLAESTAGEIDHFEVFESPLHLAARKGYSDIVKVIVSSEQFRQQLDEFPNCSEWGGPGSDDATFPVSPLFSGLLNPSCVAVLLEAGFSPFTRTQVNPEASPFRAACDAKLVETLFLFCMHAVSHRKSQHLSFEVAKTFCDCVEANSDGELATTIWNRFWEKWSPQNAPPPRNPVVTSGLKEKYVGTDIF